MRRLLISAPDKPFADDFKVSPEDVEEPTEVTLTLTSVEGEELISYHPYALDRSKPLPEPVIPLDPDPKSIDNIEDLYYIGMQQPAVPSGSRGSEHLFRGGCTP